MLLLWCWVEEDFRKKIIIQAGLERA